MNSDVMIALVSEQRMQNIIPVFQKSAHLKRLWLVRSTEANVPGARFARAWENTRATVSNLVAVSSVDPAVGAYDIAATRDLVAQLLDQELPDQVVVNFTGGTKCMSIGAYLAAQTAGVTALYVDTADDKLVWFHPDGRVEEQEFDLAGRLTVPIYLQASGKQINATSTQQYALPEWAYTVARQLVSLWPQCIDTLDVLGKAISQGTSLVGSVKLDHQVTDALAQHGLVQPLASDWQIAQRGRGFLGGKWLDAMAFVLLQDSGLFDDVLPDVRLQELENELDVLATRKGQLAVVECKSGDLGGPAILHKLQAIRSGLGTFARTFLIASCMRDRVPRWFERRAREYGVREIITAESLLNVADKVKEKMRGTA